MKTIFLTTAFLMMTAMTLAGQGTVQDASDAITSQIGSTHDIIQQMLARLRSSVPANDPASHADYVARAKAFDEKVERAMIDFEAKMKNDILKRATLWVDRINGIQNSADYAEKEALVKQQYALAKADFKKISADYARSIQDLYEILLPHMNLVKSELGSEHWHVYRYQSDSREVKNSLVDIQIQSDLSSPNRLMPETGSWDSGMNVTDARATGVFGQTKLNSRAHFSFDNYSGPFPFPNLETPPYFWNFDAKVLPGVKAEMLSRFVMDGCFSNSCLSLYSAHAKSYLMLVKTNIDRPIKFTAAWQELVLEPFNLFLTNTQSYFDVPDAAAGQLPYDISAADYRSQALQRLVAISTNPKFDAKVPCPAAIFTIEEALCQSESGCLSADEVNQVVGRIQQSKMSKKAAVARVACFPGA